MNRRLRALVGFAVAIGVVAALVSVSGWETVFANVARADPTVLAGAVVAGAATLALRGLVVYRLLGPVDGSACGAPFAGAFLAGYFTRSVVPWGRAVGAPVTAYLLAGSSESRFEYNLAVVTAAEVLVFLASVTVAIVGLVLLSADAAWVGSAAGTVPIAGVPGSLLTGLVAATVAAVLVVVALFSIVRGGPVGTALFALADRVEAAVALLPRATIERGTVRARLTGFVGTLEGVATDRRILASAAAIALASWFVNVIPLSLALLALGVQVPLAVVLLAAPMAALGGIVPLPGGTGGIEVALAGLLVATTALTGDVATTAALLFRLSTYWVHVAIGGLGVLYVSTVGLGTVRAGDRD